MNKTIWVFLCAALLSVVVIFIGISLSRSGEGSALQEPLAGDLQLDQAVIERLSAELPLYFIANLGQLDPAVSFYVQGQDKSIFFTPQGITYALDDPVRAPSQGHSLQIQPISARSPLGNSSQRWAVKLDFVGANPQVVPLGETLTPALISYFLGQSNQWQAGIPTYARVRYPELWPGIDLVFSGSAAAMKYEFVVQPGADPSLIQLAYRGASAVRLLADGQLQISTPVGGFRDAAPLAYQERDGLRLPVEMAYHLSQPELSGEQSRWQYGFKLGDYDRSLALVLDPEVLIYAGFIGGAGYDSGRGIAVDAAGSAYITGTTASSQSSFPVLVGPDLTFNSELNYDAFVVKIDPGGRLVYAGYIGGSSGDEGEAIAVDADGNAYITGYTKSDEASFPVLLGPDLTHNGGDDAFVVKVNPTGSALVYAGYVGGNLEDKGRSIAVDAHGNAYLAGSTRSKEASFPVLLGPDLTHNGGEDAFVVKVSPTGSALVFAGYVGGSGDDQANGIAVDSGGSAYLAGATGSTYGFPVLLGPDLMFKGGGADAFVAKVHPGGSTLLYAGYIGGQGYDSASAIAVDGQGNAYLTGRTNSSEKVYNGFPVLVGPDLTFNDGLTDAFVAKVNAQGTALVYAGYIGGSQRDYGSAIAVDGLGNAYVAGSTLSSQASFPVVGGPDLWFNEDGWSGIDAFVAMVSSTGSTLVYSGYIGGRRAVDYANAIAVDAAGNAYVTGETKSTQKSFPVIGGPDLTHNGIEDAFVTKVGPASRGPVDLGVNRVVILQSITMPAPQIYIANKPTLLRAFVSVEGAASQTGVTGRLTRYVNAVPLDTLQAGPITAPYRMEEGEMLAALTFNLPSEWLVPGTAYVLELDPHNTIAETNEDNNRYPASGSQQIKFLNVPVLEIVIVPVTYARAGAPVTTPDLSDLSYLTTFFEQVYPVAEVQYSIRTAPFIFTHDLRDRDTWNVLLRDLTTLHEYEDPQQSKVYYGLVDQWNADGGVGSIGGIAWMNSPQHPKIQKTGAGKTGGLDPHMGAQFFAHEIGHIYGLGHSESAGGYPLWIGQWGYHSAASELLDPDLHADYMYWQMYNQAKYWTAGSTFAGIYHAYAWMENWNVVLPYYSLSLPLVQTGGMPAANAAPSGPHLLERSSWLHLNGIITPDGRISVEPVFSGPGTPGRLTGSQPEDSGYQVVLLDGAGQALAVHALELTPIAFEEISEDYIGYGFRARLPHPPELAVLQIHKDGQLVFERQGRGTAPALDRRLSVARAQDDLNLTWGVHNEVFGEETSALAYRVLFSPDGGASWLVLAANTTQPRLAIPGDLLQGATQPRLRVLASDGVLTAEQEYDLMGYTTK
jgi:hypothetical protein